MALSRQKRQLLRTLVPGLAIMLLVAVALLWRMRGGDEYVPGEEVEGITSGLSRAVPEGFTPVMFREVALESGIDFQHFHGSRSVQLPEDMGSGVAWGDYDGDGDPDLFVVNEAGSLAAEADWDASPASCRLYRNEGDGSFVDVTEAAGVGLRTLGMTAVWIDHDGDRDLDLLVTGYGSMTLYQNQGDGSFLDATADAGLTQKGYWAAASFGDFDRDGDLDLYVCGYVQYSFDPKDRERATSQYESVIPATLNPSTYPPHPNLLLENDGSGKFTDVTGRAGVANEKGRSLGAIWCDFDEDGWLDLYVANDISDNVMYRNRGDGTFDDTSHASWVADYRGAMGMAVCDWDSDGDLDIFVTHWIAQENALYVNLLAERRGLEGAAPDAFCSFQDDADRMGVGQIALDFVGWGTFFFDFDNDTRPDLFVANGSTFQKDDDPSQLVPMRSQLFWNHGPQHGFYDVGEFVSRYFLEEHVGRGAACADYDGDGDQDLAVVHHGGRLALLRNDLDNGNHWLGIRLRGKGKNTHGLGATVTVTCGERVQAYAVGATPSYLSWPDTTLHFGLAENGRAEKIEIRWPDGTEQLLTDVEGDRVLTVEEPE